VEMVLTGLVGKEIVAHLNQEGGKAVSLSGKDGNLIRVRKLMHRSVSDPSQEIDIGFVGAVESINPELLLNLEKGGFIPVISPLGVGPEGHAYNVNADTIAGEIASALHAERLILLSDIPGVLKDVKNPDSLMTSLSVREVNELIASGTAEGGMIPKLKACLRALGGGVKKAHIIDGRTPHSVLLELFTDTGVGTQIYPDV
jgi:acetylglutamate kinase